MKEENQMKVVRLAAGVVLVIVYATTGMNGAILALGAFLCGFPVEKIIDRYLKEKSD